MFVLLHTAELYRLSREPYLGRFRKHSHLYKLPSHIPGTCCRLFHSVQDTLSLGNHTPYNKNSNSTRRYTRTICRCTKLFHFQDVQSTISHWHTFLTVLMRNTYTMALSYRRHCILQLLHNIVLINCIVPPRMWWYYNDVPIQSLATLEWEKRN